MSYNVPVACVSCVMRPFLCAEMDIRSGDQPIPTDLKLVYHDLEALLAQRLGFHGQVKRDEHEMPVHIYWVKESFAHSSSSTSLSFALEVH